MAVELIIAPEAAADLDEAAVVSRSPDLDTCATEALRLP
jgi:hypothetical protein